MSEHRNEPGGDGCCPHAEGKHWARGESATDPEPHCTKCAEYDDSDTPEESRGFSRHEYRLDTERLTGDEA